MLVLGGSGHLGRHICGAFAAGGYEVLAISRGPGPAGVRSLRLDLAALPAAGLRRLIDAERPTAVINAAGAVWGSPARQQLVDSNVRLVERLVQAMAPLPFAPRLIHLGTTHEYGDIPAGARLTETTDCRPVSPYGETKLQASRLVLGAAGEGRVDGLVLRLGNVFGPGMPPRSMLGGVTARLAEADRTRSPATIELFTLSDRRDFLDVRDAAVAVLLAAQADATARVVNIGSGRAVQVRSLVLGLIEASGVPARLVERRPAGPGERGRPDWQEIDPRLAARLLRWHPRRGRDETLRDMWESARRR
ncbi:NAD(P)-dependent oxidoreductase [Streptomyces sp. SID11385]|nr:NAD(P)-dependent oxidoreductase [Streptomyces sp. SID11385]